MMGLTQRQREVLEFLRSEAAQGRCPSYEEMARHLGGVARSNIFRIVEALAERGYIRKLPKRRRSIELIEPGTPRAASLTLFSTAELRSELDRRVRQSLAASAQVSA